MKKYGFIDLHMHSRLSAESGCDAYVSQILDNVLETLNESDNKTACISITDHNSILGSKEAIELTQNEEKYKDITVISGAEFTVNTDSIEKASGGKLKYGSIHVLAYNFDVNDKDLVGYSTIHNYQTMVDKFAVNTGHQMLCAKKKIESQFNIKLSYEMFLHCVGLAHSTARSKMVDITCEKYPQLVKNDILNCIKKVFPEEAYFDQNAEKGANLDIVEVTTMVKNAGGNIVIAHPYLIKENDMIAPKFIKENGNSTDSFEKQTIAFYARFLKYARMVTHNNIDGLELFHSSNCSSKTIQALAYLAKKYHLFITGGSDYHGPHKLPSNLISKCLSSGLEYVSSLDFKKAETKNTQNQISSGEQKEKDEKVKNILSIVNKLSNENKKRKLTKAIKNNMHLGYLKTELIEIIKSSSIDENKKKILIDFVENPNAKEKESENKMKDFDVACNQLTSQRHAIIKNKMIVNPFVDYSLEKRTFLGKVKWLALRIFNFQRHTILKNLSLGELSLAHFVKSANILSNLTRNERQTLYNSGDLYSEKNRCEQVERELSSHTTPKYLKQLEKKEEKERSRNKAKEQKKKEMQEARKEGKFFRKKTLCLVTYKKDGKIKYKADFSTKFDRKREKEEIDEYKHGLIDESIENKSDCPDSQSQNDNGRDAE